MPAASSCLDREISVRIVIVTACCHQSNGTLKAIRILRFLWYPSHWRKLREHSIKSRGDLEKVGNRMVAIASMNTCKH